MTGNVQVDKIVTWLNDQADERLSRGTTAGAVQYAIYIGLRDRIVRGDFNKEEE